MDTGETATSPREGDAAVSSPRLLSTASAAEPGRRAPAARPRHRGSHPDKARPRLPRALGWVLPLGLYAVFALLVYAPVGTISSNRLTSTGEDVGPMVWYLAALPHYLFHGLNPFFTLGANFPYGANLASNTSMPLLGLIASPITLTEGPVAAFNAMVILGFFLSAAAMFYVLRKCVRFRPAAFFGGLVYGFGPFMIGQGYDHPFLTFEPLPPLIVAVSWELVVRRHWSARRSGLLLGLLCSAQFLVSAEVLADVALLVALGVVVLALRNYRLVAERWRHVVAGLGWALLPLLVFAGYPIGYLTFGPEHLLGSPQPFEIASYRADLLGPVIPTILERLGPVSWKALGSRFGGGNFVENGNYLGAPLVVATLATTWFARRRGIVRLAALLALVAFALSLGTPLMIDGANTGIPLPFGVLTHLPFVQNESALGYSLFVDLFVAVLLAQGMDRFIEARQKRLAAGSKARAKQIWTWVAPVAATAALGIVLVPLTPNIPYATTSAGIPAYFTDGSASQIPSGSVVLTYPYPSWPYLQPDIWSADTELRFRLFGGQVVSPQSPTVGVGEATPPLLQPYLMQELFATATYGSASYVYGSSVADFTLPPPDASTLTQLRSFCVIYGVGDIVVDPAFGGAATVVTYLTDTLDARPVVFDGVEVWYDVQDDLAKVGF
jgi:hypothetical protein